ncbi:MAG: DUF1326 domain-containing protein [Pseudomonadota bacterium]
MAKKKKSNVIPQWEFNGELAMNCNCDVFCPCVISLGAARPTQGYCQTWFGVKCDDGFYGDTDLSGLSVGFMVDIPGRMGEGNWTVALYIDELADDEQFKALEMIMTGSARGTTGLFQMLVGNYLGARREATSFSISEDGIRTFIAGKAIFGQIKPLDGVIPGKGVTINNTPYWMGPVVTTAVGLKSKFRDFGRVWNFDGHSAEICQIEWAGP